MSIMGYSQEYSSPECRSPYRDRMSCVQLLGIVRQNARTDMKAMRWEANGAALSDPTGDRVAAKLFLRRPSLRRRERYNSAAPSRAITMLSVCPVPKASR